MAGRYVSDQALAIQHLFHRVVSVVRDKQEEWDSDSRDVVLDVLYNAIEGITPELRRPSVRGHLAPALLQPDVDARSSFKLLFDRLRNLINCACVLADLAYIGPAASADESAALDHIKQTLRNIVKNISPASSDVDSFKLKGSSIAPVK